MKSFLSLIWGFTVFLSLNANANICVDLFKPTREPHFPSSVYAKFPEAVVPKLLDVVSMDVLSKALNQMTMEVSADIPLPEGLGAKSKKIEMDIDVEQMGVQNGSIVSRLSTTLKTPQPEINKAAEMPKDLLQENAQANSMLALHIDMINAAIKSSLSDLATSPLKFEADGVKYLMTKAPVLRPGNEPNRVLIRAEATIPRESIAFSSLAFKKDIRAEVSLDAEFIIDQNNSVSLRVLGVHKNDFNLDAETIRFSSSSWLINKVANMQISQFNRQSQTKPIVISGLFKIPPQVMGLNVQLLKMYLDNDGYLKVQLNIEPKSEQDAKIRVRFKDRE